VQAFGVIGLVIGPLVFSLLMSIIDIYKQVLIDVRLPIASPGATITRLAVALLFYMFRPQPTHHAHPALRSSQAAIGTAPPHVALYRLWSGVAPAGVSVLQSVITSAALRARKNAAAAPRPPSLVALSAAAARFPRPCADSQRIPPQYGCSSIVSYTGRAIRLNELPSLPSRHFRANESSTNFSQFVYSSAGTTTQ
jgi:hypothetical protein